MVPEQSDTCLGGQSAAYVREEVATRSHNIHARSLANRMYFAPRTARLSTATEFRTHLAGSHKGPPRELVSVPE